MFGVLWLVCGFVVFALDSAYWLGSSGLSWGLFSFGLVFGGVFVWFVFVWFVLVSFGLVFGGMERGWGSISNKTIPPPLHKGSSVNGRYQTLEHVEVEVKSKCSPVTPITSTPNLLSNYFCLVGEGLPAQ